MLETIIIIIIEIHQAISLKQMRVYTINIYYIKLCFLIEANEATLLSLK